MKKIFFYILMYLNPNLFAIISPTHGYKNKIINVDNVIHSNRYIILCYVSSLTNNE